MAITILDSAIIGSASGTISLPAIDSTGAKGILLFLAVKHYDVTTAVSDNRGTGWTQLYWVRGNNNTSWEVWTRPILPTSAGTGHLVIATNQSQITSAWVVAVSSDSGLLNPTWTVRAEQTPAEHVNTDATSTNTIGVNSSFPTIDTSGGSTEVAFASVLRYKSGISADVVLSVTDSYLIDKQIPSGDAVNPLAAFAWKNSTAADVPTWTFSASRGNVDDMTNVVLLHESGDAPPPPPSDTTVWTVPSGLNANLCVITLEDVGDLKAGDEIPGAFRKGESPDTDSALGDDQVGVPGDYSGTSVAIGVRYSTDIKLSKLYVREQAEDGGNAAETDALTQVHFLKAKYDKTGGVEVTVLPTGRSTAYLNDFVGPTNTEEGTLVAPVMNNNEQVEIHIKNNTCHRPFTIVGLAWDSTVSQRTRR